MTLLLFVASQLLFVVHQLLYAVSQHQLLAVTLSQFAAILALSELACWLSCVLSALLVRLAVQLSQLVAVKLQAVVATLLLAVAVACKLPEADSFCTLNPMMK